MMLVNFVVMVTVVVGGSVCGDCGVVSTGGGFREVMSTSPPE